MGPVTVGLCAQPSRSSVFQAVQAQTVHGHSFLTSRMRTAHVFLVGSTPLNSFPRARVWHPLAKKLPAAGLGLGRMAKDDIAAHGPRWSRGASWGGAVHASLAGSADGASSSGASEPSASMSKPNTVSKSDSQGIAGPVQLASTVAVVAAITVLAALTVAQGSPTALMDSFSKSGFAAAFSLIFVSEIGDKTFFIAALLAMRHSRAIVLAGSVSALGLMSAISAVIGRVFREVPAQLKTSVPIGEYLACALLVWFGVSSIRSALALPSHSTATSAAPAASPSSAASEQLQAEGSESLVTQQADEASELTEAREFVEQATGSKSSDTPLGAFWETFSLVFLAEWGDRSMLATIALGAAQSPIGVALGATWGHLLATAIAVLGGAFLSRHISERTIGLASGLLFLAFAAATILGYG